MNLDYYSLISHLVDEVCAINRRYNFRSEGRSPEDVARFHELWAKMDEIRDVYDLAHPVAPCPTCGEGRQTSMGGVCMNLGEPGGEKCPEAPWPGG